MPTTNRPPEPPRLGVPDWVSNQAAHTSTYQQMWAILGEQPEWGYAIPKEGAVKYLDNICITASSERYETALHFMNYLLEPESAAATTNYTYYASPNLAAREFIDEEILNDPGIFPSEEVTAKLAWLTEVGDAVFIYDEMWTAIKGQ